MLALSAFTCDPQSLVRRTVFLPYLNFSCDACPGFGAMSPALSGAVLPAEGHLWLQGLVVGPSGAGFISPCSSCHLLDANLLIQTFPGGQKGAVIFWGSPAGYLKALVVRYGFCEY